MCICRYGCGVLDVRFCRFFRDWCFLLGLVVGFCGVFGSRFTRFFVVDNILRGCSFESCRTSNLGDIRKLGSFCLRLNFVSFLSLTDCGRS